jgi:hypothetical protein
VELLPLTTHHCLSQLVPVALLVPQIQPQVVLVKHQVWVVFRLLAAAAVPVTLVQMLLLTEPLAAVAL